ncbi:hypothetical protein B2J93_4469 [Marssonina coronariae]|uniref:Uncharacterized protein n=1 Tax=Diplocarpon coronariae TaxID=2795749 RepID=A0A218ZBI9_9HELO|nr:hypothetical protein B2J93_4469 [Marssonina coronariae]
MAARGRLAAQGDYVCLASKPHLTAHTQYGWDLTSNSVLSRVGFATVTLRCLEAAPDVSTANPRTWKHSNRAPGTTLDGLHGSGPRRASGASPRQTQREKQPTHSLRSWQMP